MGTSALPEVLPIGVVLYIVAYMAFCLLANIHAEKQKKDHKDHEK